HHPSHHIPHHILPQHPNPIFKHHPPSHFNNFPTHILLNNSHILIPPFPEKYKQSNTPIHPSPPIPKAKPLI
ncbi:YtoQ family protein, partial [Bacillus pumilus]|uniref:YtoQ family protein n=1 Tax=Bacillus pumilus TaxID=1408 RepID=UPI001642A9DF